MGVTFPNESLEYRNARNKLLESEVAVRREMEAVATEIRALPPGGPVPEDYEFDHIDAKGAPAKVRLSELFRPGTDTLILYHYMFPRHPSDKRRGPKSGLMSQLPTPILHCFARQLGGSNTACRRTWSEHRGSREGTYRTGRSFRLAPRLALFEAALRCQKQLQTRLSWRG
jgi:predicted dithiol-disulfide oxidoreductase (DUF899 family)